ncbi:hypothetical protein [Falsirhodobacter deserti]|uniref:hypothetical protein n=1 Tax=Falsirhodobacter deserti TaxID=1365611 RepID=UPI000FE3AF44|nr:hypothetical protein [Falsirhodobacter deserti]
MSDRPVEPQISDILASIRQVTAETPVAAAGPLILTQAQRVPAEHDSSPGTGTAVADAAPPLTGEVHDRMAPIDEDVLQELVRELLTEELQGQVGERMTRNIRKMIRAEINQALAEQRLLK